ncbi:hypothetical protein NFC73_02430 [Pseudarthrobacter sp. RMG13]|uniref:Uncharacterized protein n=1 Tax=Pseudarthrobacter humi TaxID=2952523 RepID=A0ABT1LKH5_9MICC|nr:hypothetical protein [Pseudarthrobacter humi]MCP8998596.1 hypothetical protein [Pseudarthrobacter humi]
MSALKQGNIRPKVLKAQNEMIKFSGNAAPPGRPAFGSKAPGATRSLRPG